MSAAALVLATEGTLVQREVVLHPVPRGSQVHEMRDLLRRSATISIALHVCLLLIAVTIHYWPRPAAVGTPQEQILDVTIIPLSALDTLLPKGSPEPPKQQSVVLPDEDSPMAEPEKKAPKVVQEKKQEKAAVRPRKQKKVPAETQSNKSSSEDTNASATASLSPSRLGVANGEDIPLQQARISYQDMVATLLAKAKRYPERALKRGMVGEGSVRLEISSDGSLTKFEIVRSTDASILDEELRAMVRRAAPFPAFPSDLRKNSLALIVPIAFRLQ